MYVKSASRSLGLVSWDPYVARRATIFEFATCCWVMSRSPRIVTVNYELIDVSQSFSWFLDGISNDREDVPEAEMHTMTGMQP